MGCAGGVSWTFCGPCSPSSGMYRAQTPWYITVLNPGVQAGPSGAGTRHSERLSQLWEEAKEEIYLTEPDPAAFKKQTLPLARIKKVG